MKLSSQTNQLAGVKIRRLSIRADSRIDARRLADNLPGLLHKRLESGPAPFRRGIPGSWDDVADQLATVIEAELEQHDG